MATCDSLLATGFLKNCDHPLSKAGIKKKWYINLEDIDKANTTFLGTSEQTTISKLALVKGRNFYAIQGVKSQTSASYALSVTDYGNGYIHTDNYALQDRSTPHLIGLKQLARGARIVSVVERVDGGKNDKSAFWVYGWGSGMQLTEHTGGTLDNNGNDLLTLSTIEGEEEYYPPMIFLDTDYATTLAWLEANTYKGDEIDPRKLARIALPLSDDTTVYALTNYHKPHVGDKVVDQDDKPIIRPFILKSGEEIDVNEYGYIIYITPPFKLITVTFDTVTDEAGTTDKPAITFKKKGVDIDRSTIVTDDGDPYQEGTFKFTDPSDNTVITVETEKVGDETYVKSISEQPAKKKD